MPFQFGRIFFFELDAKKEKLSHKNANPLKRKVGEDDTYKLRIENRTNPRDPRD